MAEAVEGIEPEFNSLECCDIQGPDGETRAKQYLRCRVTGLAQERNLRVQYCMFWRQEDPYSKYRERVSRGFVGEASYGMYCLAIYEPKD